MLKRDFGHFDGEGTLFDDEVGDKPVYEIVVEGECVATVGMIASAPGDKHIGKAVVAEIF